MSKRELYKCDSKMCWNDCEGKLEDCIKRSAYVKKTRKELLEKRNKNKNPSSKEIIKKRLKSKEFKNNIHREAN
jgi:GTP-sensing pleiotropic transcriptional regulator CodY